ncbi:hypothetical protein CDV36_003253 [Fusarium kuroshium]|uniref:Uncharacterized protein n=1 Tax=Fusarium kuroshium TaxID=2010991 RepID=A0A3M2SHT2_9HYPO|nr:hypothetical protein CDV36_003253 [Fusarium kuroshium]
MACAIAAAREAYTTPNWKPLAQICCEWANELVTPIISAGDSDTLTAILLLLVYELADPSRGFAWELLDLAARTCLQLGWHQAPLIHHPVGAEQGDSNPSTRGARYCGPDEIRLMSVLKEIEGTHGLELSGLPFQVTANNLQQTEYAERFETTDYLGE